MFNRYYLKGNLFLNNSLVSLSVKSTHKGCHEYGVDRRQEDICTSLATTSFIMPLLRFDDITNILTGQNDKIYPQKQSSLQFFEVAGIPQREAAEKLKNVFGEA